MPFSVTEQLNYIARFRKIPKTRMSNWSTNMKLINQNKIQHNLFLIYYIIQLHFFNNFPYNIFTKFLYIVYYLL